MVNAAFKKRGIVAKMPGGEVNNEDMARLRPGCWLNDETINMYGLMILARSKKAAEERAKAKSEGRKCDTQWLCYWDVHFFNSFFYSKVEKEGHSAVKRWTRKVSCGAAETYTPFRCAVSLTDHSRITDRSL